MMNSWKEHIDNRLGGITMSNDLSEKILDATIYKESPFKRQLSFKKWAAVTLVICMILMGSISAFATTIPAVNDWLYSINHGIAERLLPVNKTVEDKGIKVDVLYAINDNHNALVYFSVQDTTGNRVDESTDICNYFLEGPFAFNCQMLSYDEKKNTAVFQLLGTGGGNMANKMTTLAISSFLSNKIEHEWYDTEINMVDVIDTNVKSEPISNYDYRGGNEIKGEFSVLKPDQMQIPLGDDIHFVTISNIGFVDGKLHIQTKWNESVDDHGQLNLIDANGNEIASNNYYFDTATDSTNSELRSKHIEYVFDISDIDSLSKYHLWATFTEDGDYIEGDWKVNFRLSDSENIKLDSVKNIADTMEISELGLYFEGYKAYTEESDLNVTMKDGKELSYSSWDTSMEEGESGAVQANVTVLFENPVKLENIKEISLNGTVIYKK